MTVYFSNIMTTHDYLIIDLIVDFILRGKMWKTRQVKGVGGKLAYLTIKFSGNICKDKTQLFHLRGHILNSGAGTNGFQFCQTSAPWGIAGS